MNPTEPVHHVFVDFENVQAIDLGSIGDKPVEVTMVLGKAQKRLEVSLVQELLKRPGGVRLIEMDFSGKNALDLALACHLGMAAAGDPTGSFHIISKDKDFDPLVAHLRRANIKVVRHDRFSLSAITGDRKAAGRADGKRAVAPDWVAIIEKRLQKNATARPKRKTTLLSLIQAQSRDHLPAGEASRIVDALCQRGTIAIDAKDKVTYLFPSG